ncbi:hypothetical protein DBADOPDK_02977 [Pseudomonas sp. MM223]|nr:hypothetical protein DBADOPDK_02977 [Pseudomonas sp. MM223]
MYTGIVQAVRPLLDVTTYPGHNQFTIDLTPELLDELKIGASVSVEGTCLSVTEIVGTQVKFDAMTATLERTNLCFFKAGQGVNIERSAKMNAEVGGHLMAGHIATTAEIVELSIKETGAFIKFRMPPEWGKYVFPARFHRDQWLQPHRRRCRRQRHHHQPDPGNPAPNYFCQLQGRRMAQYRG